MQTTDHTFPIPEIAAHQLEELEHELHERPLNEKVGEFIRINRWRMLVLAGMAGIATGIYFAARQQY